MKKSRTEASRLSPSGTGYAPRLLLDVQNLSLGPDEGPGADESWYGQGLLILILILIYFHLSQAPPQVGENIGELPLVVQLVDIGIGAKSSNQ